MTTIGIKLTTPPADTMAQQIGIASVQQQAFDTRTLAIPPSAGWITRLGAMAKAQTNTPHIWLAIWAADGSGGGPGTLLARTDGIAVFNVMQNYEAPIAWVNPTLFPASIQTALRVTQGQQFWLGVVNQVSGGGGNVLIGLQPGTVNHQWWRKTNAGGVPTNPFGAATDSFNTTFLFPFYAEFTDSTPPVLAAQLPVADASLTTLTPTFEATFTDPDAALGDTLASYTIFVRNKTTLATVWTNTFTLSTTELANARISRVYGGPALATDTAYEWAVAGTDLTGEVSVSTTLRTFSVPSAAVVDSTGGTPTGKVDGDSSQISFAAHWWHTSNIGANAVQVRILNASGGVLVEGPLNAKTIAAASGSPGTAFTVTPAEAGIGTLPYGVALSWQIRARGTNGVLSPYSTPVDFRTNAIPSTPILISPANNAFSTTLPALVIASTDADADDVPLTDVVWDFEITQLLTGQIRTAVAGSFNAGLGRATFQTTSTQVPAEGPYSWRARARDVSAGSVGITPYSAAQTFNFGVGPVVTITSPASLGTVSTATPRITWISDDVQTAYQVSIYNVLPNGTRGSLVTATPKVLSANLFYDVPAGLLVNNTQYELVVSSWDDGDFQGTSLARRFTVAFFVLQTLTNVTASVVAVSGDVEPTTPQLHWDPTTYPTVMSAQGQFTAYVIKRWEVAAGRPATEVTLVEIANAAQTTFFDYHAPPGKSLQYAAFQRVTRQDGGVIDSAEVLVAPLMVTLLTPVISVVSDPGTLRFPVMWLGANLSLGKKRRRSTYQTWGAGGVPSVAEAPGVQNLRDFSFTILADQYGSLYSHLDAIEAVADAAGPVCFRDSRKRLFMSIVSWQAKRGSSVGKIDVSMTLEQLGYVEGV